MKKVGYVCAAAAALTGMLVVSSCCALGALVHATGTGDHHHGAHQDQPTTGSAKPAAIGDQVVCPVDGMKVQVAAETPATEFHGRIYYFCSDADQRAFLKQPERYVAKQ